MTNESWIEAACEEMPVWAVLIRNLDKQLEYLMPGYKIAQIKEKFGGLRYYFDPPYDPETYEKTVPDIVLDIATTLEYRAENESFRICMYCPDKNGKHHTEVSWYCTLCNECFEKYYPNK